MVSSNAVKQINLNTGNTSTTRKMGFTDTNLVSVITFADTC